MDSVREVHKFAASVKKLKLIGKSAKELESKIKDENITFSGK